MLGDAPACVWPRRVAAEPCYLLRRLLLAHLLMLSHCLYSLHVHCSRSPALRCGPLLLPSSYLVRLTDHVTRARADVMQRRGQTQAFQGRLADLWDRLHLGPRA